MVQSPFLKGKSSIDGSFSKDMKINNGGVDHGIARFTRDIYCN
jgi:hypothetical protein